MQEYGTWRDRIAIEELKARYFRALDTKDWPTWREVFTDDVRVQVPMATTGGGVVQIAGADAYVASASKAVANCVSVHLGHMPEIVFQSDILATGVWSMEDILEWADGRQLHGYGRYHETYVKTDSGWRISELRLERTRLDLTGPWHR